MPKTNHNRRFIANDDSPRREPAIITVKCIDGSIIQAAGWPWPWDYCRGKHGCAKCRRGAKKFVASRRRRRDRDLLKKIDID